MSEKYRSPNKDPLHIEGVPEALQVKAIDELRKQQSEREIELLLGVDWNNDPARREAKEKAYAEFDQMIRDHLLNNGVSPDDEKFADYVAYLRDHSVDKVTKDKWEDGEWNESGERINDPVKTTVQGELESKFGNTDLASRTDDQEDDPDDVIFPPESSPLSSDPGKGKEPKTSEEIKELIEKGPHAAHLNLLKSSVDHLRGKLAALSAKRQGRLWTRKGGKLDEEYRAVEAEYNQQLTDLIKLRLLAEKEAGLERDQEQERLDVAFRLIEQFKKLQQESVDILKNTNVRRFVEWMTEGGAFKRIGKGVLVGVGAGVVGAALSAFIVGTGGGALAAGAAAVGATKAAGLARAFAVFDAKHGDGMQVIESDSPTSSFNLSTLQEAGAEGKSGEETTDLVHQHLMEKLEADTKAEQRKHLKATAKALGVIAVSAGAVEGISAGVNFASHYTSDVHNWAFGNNDVHAGGPPSPPEGGSGVPPEVAPATPAVPETLYNPDALSIHAGEGWYQTFKDMGIPEKDWSALLEQAGPKLHDIQVDGHSLAYQMPDGQWGIRMTPDGMMPKEALDVITQTHDHMNGIGIDTSAAPAHIETPDLNGPSGTATELTPGGTPSPESIQALTTPVEHTSVDNIIKMGVIHPSDVTSNPQLDKFTHVATWLNPDTYAQRLGLSSFEWSQLQDHIASEVTQQHNPLYAPVFEVTPAGYLRFVANEIPDATLADMLNEVRSVRSGL